MNDYQMAHSLPGEAAVHELETILDSLTSVLILVDADFTILRWNKVAETTFELEAGQVVGLHLEESGVRWFRDDLQGLILEYQKGVHSPGSKIRFKGQDGQDRILGVTLSLVESGSPNEQRLLLLGRDITEKQQAVDLQRRLMTAVEQVDDTIVITDLLGKILYANPAFERITGYRRKDVIGSRSAVLKSGKQDRAFYDNLWATLERGEMWSGHFTNRKKDGTFYEEDATISPVRDEAGQVINYVAVKKDVTERLALETQLRTAQKLESIGQLAAGIAHEINTPTQFISDNTRFIRDSFTGLEPLLALCKNLGGSGANVPDPVKALEAIAAAAQEAGLQFICDEVPGALEESLAGLSRVSEIVLAMKSFSHPEVKAKQPIDLNESIRTTVTISSNEWKYVAEIQTELDPELPLADCHPGEIGQVLLNVIVNAAHAIADAPKREDGALGTIKLATSCRAGFAEIRISDTGGGMSPEIVDRIFDPFFTTKEVGRGTGQGLAIARSVVVDKHAGTIEVETEPGQGTTFVIRIPLREPEPALRVA